MKRILNDIAGSLLGLLALVALVVVLALTYGGLRKGTGPASQAFQSPFQSPVETPTQPPYLPPETPTPQPTPRPTSTRPPEPPTRTPTPTFTPAPPTPTPEPLPTLLPGVQTFLYASTGERGPEIYRVQLDSTIHIIAPSVYRVNTPALWRSRVYLEGLHPSPDGKRVAVSWVYGEGGTFVSILNVNDGTLTPLFGEKAAIDQRAEFLDWSPKGDRVLVLGGIDNPDLGGNAWLVDPDMGQYTPVDISQTSDARQITSASFSPDGQAIVYAKSDCYQCGGEIWRISVVQQGEKQLLLQDSVLRIEDVLWSPDGRYIAFTQWRETGEFAPGELWIMDPQGGARRFLSPLTTGYYKRFTPVWSPDSRSIAFVLGEEPQSGKQANEHSFNVYIVDVLTGEVRQLTHFQNTLVLEPTFSPDGSMLAFVTSVGGVTEQFELWLVAVDGRSLRRFDERATLILNTKATTPAIAWLPEFFPGGER
jgi:Tol biopolymer transport system component